MSKHVPQRAISRLISARWAIREDALDAMINIMNRGDVNVDALSALADKMPKFRETDEGSYLQVRGNVAIINVRGPCFRYASFMTMFCGATSYEEIALQLEAARADTAIEAIIMVFDTPGGEVTGCGELAAKIRAICSEKPVIAYIDGDCCSAGYWQAAACDHIVVNASGVVGCLGVIGVFTDKRDAEKAQGLKKYELISTLTPNKRADPATDEGRAQLMRMIDATADVFLGDVGMYRGIDGGPEKVAKKFGRGDVEVGANAVSVGLADEVGDFEAVLASLNPPEVPAKKVA